MDSVHELLKIASIGRLDDDAPIAVTHLAKKCSKAQTQDYRDDD
jgi:hypothetical protein